MDLVPISGDTVPPGLVKEKVYYCNVDKKKVSKLIDAMRKLVPPKTVDVQHIKRVQPIKDDPSKLSVLLCFTYCLSYEKLKSVLHELFEVDLPIYEQVAAKYPARSKEEAAEWSQQVWPLMWRGNIAAQPPTLEPEEKLQMLERVTGFSDNDINQCCDVCIMVDPKTNSVIGSSDHHNNKDLALDHAVMDAIKSVASNTDDDMYLCFGLDVYCSQEPCIMCCMALVHSRIGRLIYKNDSKDIRGSIRYFKLHGRAQLNHTFEAWKLTAPV